MAETPQPASSGDSLAAPASDISKSAKHPVLPRTFGAFDAVTVVVGSIIGSGIFLKVDTIARHMGAFGPIIAVWVVGGVAALCGSLALAELSAMLPHAGGPYVYLRQAYGRLPAFLWGWTEFSIIRTGSLGSLACGTVIYFNRFLQSLESQGYLPAWLAEHVPISHAGKAMLAILAIVTLGAVNVVGARWAARTQNLTTIVKLSFLGFLIVGPLVSGLGRVENLQPMWPDEITADFFRAFGLALVAVFWPYDGWINIGPVAEEIRQPQRNVPLALVTGMLIVMTVYVLTTVGYHLMLPMERIQKTQTVAADVTGAILGSWGIALASLGVMVSTFGALNGNLLAGPRIYFAMARDGLFPKAIERVHPRFQTPANAIIAQAVWSVLQIVAVAFMTKGNDSQGDAFKRAFDTLTDFVILGGTAFYGLTVAAVFVLRYRLPDAERPYRTWGYPLTPLIYLASVVAVVGSLAVNDPLQVAATGVLLLTGVAVYALFRRLENKSRSSKEREF